jgi:ubiquinone/menaquinone biosynthesis C-methylase UbiE
VPGNARYDGMADWYDDRFRDYGSGRGTAGLAATHLGAGHGRPLIDVGCGTGLNFNEVQRQGWSIVGVDLSADQLRIARRRCDSVHRADGCAILVADDSFDMAVATFIHTHVDDFPECCGS